ncbi:MAG: hypothetical protein PHH58_06540, partial [Rhodoferax sp.]|nr:hypothetical protein [Rhodoferax sp.]
LTTDQVANITTAGIAALKTSQIDVLTTDQIVALDTVQIQQLSTAGIAVLDTAQVAAIETTDIAVLKTSQIRALTTTSIAALTTEQLSMFSTAQFMSLTSSQVTALGVNISAIPDLSTPIILDLNGDGVKTLSYSSGVKFDLFAQGQTVQTGWVSGGDGLLVLDRNHDGQINDGSELFGSSSTLANGTKALDGYQALRELDTNHDGVISQDDAGFKDLSVWVDGNTDGVSAVGEIKTMAALQIVKIDLQAAVGTGTDNGNIVGLTSTYQTLDGQQHAAADVWFVADKPNAASQSAPNQLALDDQVIDALDVVAQTAPFSTRRTAFVEEIKLELPGSSSQIAVDEGKTDLRSRVSSIASAMGAFETTLTGEDQAGSLVDQKTQDTGTTPQSMLAVSVMTESMKKFDLGAGLLQKVDAVVAPPGDTLNLGGMKDVTGGGFLVSSSK